MDPRRNQPLRTIASLGKTNKSKLIAYFNRRFDTNVRTGKQLARALEYEDNQIDDAFDYVADLYNADIEEQRVTQRQSTQWLNLALQRLRGIPVGGSAIIDLNDMRRFFGINQFMRILIENIDRFYGSTNAQIVLRVNDINYTLNDNTRNKLLNFVDNYLITEEVEMNSDSQLIQNITQAETIQIINKTRPATNRRQRGAFFPFYNKTDFDLSRYGVFYQDEEDYSDNCLIYAFRMAGMEQTILDSLKIFVRNREVAIGDLGEIAEKAGIQIELIRREINAVNKHYGSTGETYRIGILAGHYFLVEDTEITVFAIKNYVNVKHIENCGKIYNFCAVKKYRKSNKHFSDSFKIINAMLETQEQCLIPMTFENSNIAATQFYDRITDKIENLEYNYKTCCLPVEPKKPSNKEEQFHNLFYDFETYVDSTSKHVPYLCRSFDGIKRSVFYGVDCGLQLLKSLKKHTRLIAHNATYDYRFIVEYLQANREISRGTRLIGGVALFGKIKLRLKDSYNIIPEGLRSFSKMFALSGDVKEVMPYSLYNADTIAKRWIKIKDVLHGVDSNGFPYIVKEDQEQFISNIKRWCVDGPDGTYDIIEYSNHYCEIDCKILCEGYNKFRDWILEITQIDIDHVMTLPSLAHQYLVNMGCYDGVISLSGIPQMFIQKSVVGGRVMCASNDKAIYDTDRKKNDFDATSLYPSAMARLEGFLLGAPEVISDLNYESIKHYSGYFVEIVITSVAIHRTFPLMSFKNKDGIRQWDDYAIIGKSVIVDKTTLEDWIQYHGITFDIVRGYYFNKGFNQKIVDTIQFLFFQRAKKKAEGNPIEVVFKLLMNSSYGKTIMKPITNEVKIFDDVDEFNVYFDRHYNEITDYIHFGQKTKVTIVKPLVEHFNICQVGSSILSMSKRIMNEVMCLAEDIGIEMFYQDTDSIHLFDNEIGKLGEAFQSKYGRVLIGKQMGQFHSDFSITGAKDVIATKSIFLGKKSYIDVLQGVNKVSGEIETDYHIRLKGIPNKVILYHCERQGITPYELYTQMYEGVPITFDLTNDGSKVNFKYDKSYAVRTLSDFNRCLVF
jgi:hypothetical protein